MIALLIALGVSIALNVRLWSEVRELRRGSARLVMFARGLNGDARVRVVDEKLRKENRS